MLYLVQIPDRSFRHSGQSDMFGSRHTVFHQALLMSSLQIIERLVTRRRRHEISVANSVII